MPNRDIATADVVRPRDATGPGEAGFHHSLLATGGGPRRNSGYTHVLPPGHLLPRRQGTRSAMVVFAAHRDDLAADVIRIG